MKSSRPYLVRALIDWILDNDLTPYVVIRCDVDGVDVPEHYVNDDKIVLNVSPTATRNFSVEQEEINFDSRFDGAARHIHAPIGAVVAVYARENGAGMSFEPEDPDPDSPPDSAPPDPSTSPPEGKPKLRIV